MNGEKPVYVHHLGRWRLYRWSRTLLYSTSLGDVIPEVEPALSEDPASAHLYSRSDAPADILSAQCPDGALWKELPVVVVRQVDSIRYSTPFG